MKCPVCASKTKVNDSRVNVDTVDRRRECLGCGYRFNTVELDQDMYENLLKKGNDPDVRN